MSLFLIIYKAIGVCHCVNTHMHFFVFRAMPSTEYTTAKEEGAAQDEGAAKEEGASKDIIQDIPIYKFHLTDNCS